MLTDKVVCLRPPRNRWWRSWWAWDTSRNSLFFDDAASGYTIWLSTSETETLEVGVAAVAGEDERDPGEAPVASISRESAIDDSRRREGILDWDLAPGGARGEFCPKLLAK
jgi:hypothetical protein